MVVFADVFIPSEKIVQLLIPPQLPCIIFALSVLVASFSLATFFFDISYDLEVFNIFSEYLLGLSVAIR